MTGHPTEPTDIPRPEQRDLLLAWQAGRERDKRKKRRVPREDEPREEREEGEHGE